MPKSPYTIPRAGEIGPGYIQYRSPFLKHQQDTNSDPNDQQTEETLGKLNRTWQNTSRFIIDGHAKNQIGVRLLPVNINGTTAIIKITVPRLDHCAHSFSIGIVTVPKGKITTRRKVANALAQATQAAKNGLYRQEHIQATSPFKYVSSPTLRAFTWCNTGASRTNLEMSYSFPLQMLSFKEGQKPTGILFGMQDTIDKKIFPFFAVTKKNRNWFGFGNFSIRASCPSVSLEQSVPTLKQIARAWATKHLDNPKTTIQSLGIPHTLNTYMEMGPLIFSKLREYHLNENKCRAFTYYWTNRNKFLKEEEEYVNQQKKIYFEL